MSDKNNEHAGKAIALEGAISYQENSIVSKTLIDKQAGTVTLFAFDKDQGLSEHTSPYDAVVYILDGEAEITVSANNIQAKQGDMVIMPAQKPHALKATSRLKMMLIMMRS